MTEVAASLPSSTRSINPELSARLRRLEPGQRIKITQKVRVGRKEWTATVIGVFRAFRFLATGLATDRVQRDAIVVVTVHFTKDNGELSSVTLDEHSDVELVDG